MAAAECMADLSSELSGHFSASRAREPTAPDIPAARSSFGPRHDTSSLPRQGLPGRTANSARPSELLQDTNLRRQTAFRVFLLGLALRVSAALRQSIYLDVSGQGSTRFS
jgi:hypothetical protein